jgi:molybdopterin converting factor small subunit
MEVMKIKIKIIGPFIYEAGFSEKELDLEKPLTAGQLLSLINLQEGRPKIMTRNGKAISPKEQLEDGDRVAICPIYSGG